MLGVRSAKRSTPRVQIAPIGAGVFASERVTRFKTRVYDDLCGFDPVDRVGCGDKIEKSENGFKFEEFRSFARTRVGVDSNNTRSPVGDPAVQADDSLGARSSDRNAATASRDPQDLQERPLIPHDTPEKAPQRGEVVPTGTTQRPRGARDEMHVDVQADGTSEEGKEGGMLGLPATTGRESTFSSARGENARPLLAAKALAPTLFPRLANGSVARAACPSISSTRKRFSPSSPMPQRSASRTSSRARVTANPRGFIASPPAPLPPATHEHALTTTPRRANHRAADRAVSGIFERDCPKAAQPLQYWMGEGWGFVPSANICGVRSPGKAKERAQ